MNHFHSNANLAIGSWTAINNDSPPSRAVYIRWDSNEGTTLNNPLVEYGR